MIQTALQLPHRQSKPRTRGLTMVIDSGLPLSTLNGLLESAGSLIDLVKLGWGTALVSSELDAKLAALRHHGVPFYFGGTLFEKHVLQDRFDDFRALLQAVGAQHVEVSNGTLPMSNTEKAGYIRKLAEDLVVLSEVGAKDPERSERMAPSAWIECVEEDLDAGASLAILEARESGRSGICRPDGELRYGLIEELLMPGVPVDRLLFEAPTTALQAYLIKRIGPEANLGNVASTDVIPLETLRLGLRSDTLTAFE